MSKTQTFPTVSAVIPFRNRDPRRLRAAVTSIANSCNLPHEIVISDYGSDNPEIAIAIAREFNTKLVYTDAQDWSRSACLNAGFKASSGTVLLGADADIVWSPGAIDHAANEVNESSRHCVAFECQFMGPDVTVDEVLRDDNSAWERYDRSSHLNPRWGVGMLFFPRTAFEITNGYEERMKTYGYEDNDFSDRLRAAGYPVRWEGSDKFRAYHIWHKPVGQIAKTDKTIQKDYDANRDLFLSLNSVVRNTVQGSVSGHPLVSIAIATKDRGDLLEVALSSTLCQTVQDFEVIVVDDGSNDHTRAVVESFKDERIRYFYQESAGISAARNSALDHSIGRFTAVMDDDDIMPPWRLEDSLAAIRAGDHGAVGSFISFTEDSGKLLSWADPVPSMKGLTATGGFAGHPTWMIRTDTLKAFRYDTSFTSSVDHNIAARMLRSGIRLNHANRVLNLRRIHDGQVTTQDASFQNRGARLDTRWVQSLLTPQETHALAKLGRENDMSTRPAEREQSEIIPYLPDHLVSRSILVRVASESTMEWLRSSFHAETGAELRTPNEYVGMAWVSPVTWRQAAMIASRHDATIIQWHASTADRQNSERSTGATDFSTEILARVLAIDPDNSVGGSFRENERDHILTRKTLDDGTVKLTLRLQNEGK